MNIPRLRFNNYHANLKTVKLGNIVNWTRGKKLLKHVINSSGKGTPIVHYADLYKFRPVQNHVIHWSTSNQGTLIPLNSLLFPMSDVTPNGLATTTTITRRGVMAGRNISIGTLKNTQKYSASFLSYEINSQPYKILRLVTGTTVMQIYPNSLSTIKLNIPTSLKEQLKISSFFAKLDKLINLQQSKLTLLKKLRSGYLQKIFRHQMLFNGSHNDWKVIKLGDIVHWQRGKKLSKSKLNTIGKGTPVVHYADLYKFSAIQDNVIHWSTSGEGVSIPSNSLLFPMSDVTPDGLATTTNLIRDNVKASGDTLIAHVNNDNDAGFLSYEINANPHKILRLVVGTTVRHVHARDLSSIKLSIPPLIEQHKIARFFKSLDNDMVYHLTKINYLCKLKKAYLQKMFC